MPGLLMRENGTYAVPCGNQYDIIKNICKCMYEIK